MMPECPKCSARMDEGFMMDQTQGGVRVGTWVSGQPEKSFWTGLKIRGRQLIQVRTYRCRACGFLESYARPES